MPIVFRTELSPLILHVEIVIPTPNNTSEKSRMLPTRLQLADNLALQVRRHNPHVDSCSITDAVAENTEVRALDVLPQSLYMSVTTTFTNWEWIVADFRRAPRH